MKEMIAGIGFLILLWPVAYALHFGAGIAVIQALGISLVIGALSLPITKKRKAK